MDTLKALYAVATSDQAAILDHLAQLSGIAPESSVRRIPLVSKTTIAGWTVVDAADYADLSQHRWYRSYKGYAIRQIRVNGRSTGEFMHRRIIGLERGDRRQTDHINRNKLDNRRENLRVATNAQNAQNITAGFGRSGVRGVHWISGNGRWAARATIAGTTHYLGSFETIEEAAAVAANWRLENVPFSPEASA